MLSKSKLVLFDSSVGSVAAVELGGNEFKNQEAPPRPNPQLFLSFFVRVVHLVIGRAIVLFVTNFSGFFTNLRLVNS